ncbi:MAG: hypothetical protein R3264_22260, partial [Anaerolineae bacterium]|nr:hypothetical protein [Anaerolineae bacterium]
ALTSNSEKHYSLIAQQKSVVVNKWSPVGSGPIVVIGLPAGATVPESGKSLYTYILSSGKRI